MLRVLRSLNVHCRTRRHLCSVSRETHDIATKLGFSIIGQSIDYTSSYTPISLDLESLIFIPHGKTPSNEKLLFQSYKESKDSKLLPASQIETKEGAQVFIDQYSHRLQHNPTDFVFLRSPLERTSETANIYLDMLRNVMTDEPIIHIDSSLLEINHGSWHGMTVSEILDDKEKALATSYRAGSFLAAPCDGESNLDLLWRCYIWLQSIQYQYPNKIVCVFGHGTFQNAIETLLCSYGATSPATIFTREPGQSHLKRGYPHAVFPPFHTLRSFNNL